MYLIDRLIIFLKSIFSALGFDLRRLERIATIENAFDTRHSKNALISYLPWERCTEDGSPIISSCHTNQWECMAIAKAFGSVGFNVDVIRWDDRRFVPRKDYDVLLDIHDNIERLFPLVGGSCIKVLHATGAHWMFQNRAEYDRLLALQQRRGASLLPRRTAAPGRGIELADHVTLLGNDFTESTFSFAKKAIRLIPLSTSAEFPWPAGKQFHRIRRNFIWFGGAGMVHKGLDVTLEAFVGLPQYHLTICGPVHDEPDFENEYHQELYHTANIYTRGWADVSSPEFVDIANEAVALLHPSCSEGQAGSVVVCMHAGLIPIVSRESGVDVDGFGVVLNSCSVSEIRERVKEIAELGALELEVRARQAWEYARSHHTREKFYDEYLKFVRRL